MYIFDIVYWGQSLSDGFSGLLGNHTHPKPVLILGIVLQAHRQHWSSSISANTRMSSTPSFLLLFALVLVSCTAFAVADDDCEYSGSGDCDDECWQGVMHWTNIYHYYMHHIILSLLCGKKHITQGNCHPDERVDDSVDCIQCPAVKQETLEIL